MDNKLSHKYREVKLARQDRKFCGAGKAHGHIVRDYNRAARKAARAECINLVA